VGFRSAFGAGCRMAGFSSLRRGLGPVASRASTAKCNRNCQNRFDRVCFRYCLMKTKLLVALALSVPGFAQTTIKDALVKHWKTTADCTMAVAQAMPADSYNFRPTPEEMSFGQLMIHIGSADLNACAFASGKPRPTIPPNISQAGKEGSPEASK